MNGGKRRYVQLYNFFYLLPSILSSALSVHFIRFVCLHFFTRFPLFLFSIYTTHIIRTDSLHTFFFPCYFLPPVGFFSNPFFNIISYCCSLPLFFCRFHFIPLSVYTAFCYCSSLFRSYLFLSAHNTHLHTHIFFRLSLSRTI